MHSLDRLAPNLDDLRQLIQGLTSRGVNIQFLRESLAFIGEDSPIANLLLSMIGAFAEFERALIRESRLEGIALVKQRGVYQGRKIELSSARIHLLNERLAAGTKKAIPQDWGD